MAQEKIILVGYSRIIENDKIQGSAGYFFMLALVKKIVYLALDQKIGLYLLQACKIQKGRRKIQKK